MEEAYFHTRFRVPVDASFPAEFAIISAYATTGQFWSADRNEEADQRLRARFGRIRGLDGASGGLLADHAALGTEWAVAISL